MVVAEYAITESTLNAIEKELSGLVFDVTTDEGMKEAKSARKRLTSLRTGLERKRQKIKKPILSATKAIDGQAKGLTERIRHLEEPIDQQIRSEESRIERERLLQEEAERKRLDAIRHRIEAMRAAPGYNIGAPVSTIEAAMDKLMADPLEGFDECEREAALVRDEAVARLHDLLEPARQREKDQAELEELRRFKAEQQAKQEAEEKAAAQQAESEKPRENTEEQNSPSSKDNVAYDEAAPSGERSSLLSAFVERHGGAPTTATTNEQEFDVRVEWQGYSRGFSTYRVKAASAEEAVELYTNGEEVERVVTRDDTDKTATEARHVTGGQS